MKRLLIILGFISAILAIILSVTPLSKIAIIPLISAFVFGLIILYLSKKDKKKTKTIQYIFLMVIISLSIIIYKSVMDKNEIGDTELLEQRDEQNLEDSKEILNDLDIDEDF